MGEMNSQECAPLVSIVIATYNRPELLQDALESIARQTFSDYEIIVVDDGSTVPGAEQVCMKYKKCRYVRQLNSGESAARNYGARLARGQLLAFLDDDDKWKPDKLERQVAFLAEHPDIGVVHSPAEIIRTDGTATGELVGANNPEWRSGRVFHHAVRTCVVKSPTSLIRKEIFDRSGGFDANIQFGEDWEFWARIANSAEFGHIPEPLAYFRVHDGSTTKEGGRLELPPYMAQKLCDYVKPKDRSLVRRQCCMAYFGIIGHCTSGRSAERSRHLWKAFLLWPPCIFMRRFWGLLVFSN
jgi:glycosyltransferase involved in cell wall biosynthesis